MSERNFVEPKRRNVYKVAVAYAEHHRRSEQLVVAAEAAARTGDTANSERLYIEAAQAEADALAELDASKSRTAGIMAVETLRPPSRAAPERDDGECRRDPLAGGANESR